MFVQYRAVVKTDHTLNLLLYMYYHIIALLNIIACKIVCNTAAIRFVKADNTSLFLFLAYSINILCTELVTHDRFAIGVTNSCW